LQKKYSEFEIVETGRVISVKHGYRDTPYQVTYKGPNGHVIHFELSSENIIFSNSSFRITFPQNHLELAIPLDYKLYTSFPFPVAVFIFLAFLQFLLWCLVKTILPKPKIEIDRLS
jgi:hypothetical protein